MLPLAQTYAIIFATPLLITILAIPVLGERVGWRRWLAILVGLGLLYSRVVHARGRLWTSRALWGWILVGWGLFNLVEGVIDHHILGIHHVRSGPNQLWWDLGFLALGAVLVLASAVLASITQSGPGNCSSNHPETAAS